jgi:hypothetical protein
MVHPTSTWIAQQLREAFPYESAPSFLLFDHDQKYGLEVPAALRSLQITGRANLNPKPLAKRCCGTLGRQLAARICSTTSSVTAFRSSATSPGDAIITRSTFA